MSNHNHRNAVFALLFIMTLTFASCSSFCVENMMELGMKRMSGPGLPGWSGGPGGGTAGDEVLVQRAFEAIKAGDYSAYRELTITTADFVLKREKVNPMMEAQTYAGAVLKPQEQALQRGEFEQAVAGGEDQIDFKTAEWQGLGPLVDSGSQQLFESGSVPYMSYAIKIKQGGESIVSTELRPEFVLVDWGKSRRILRLFFGVHEVAEPTPGPRRPGYTPPDRDEYTPPPTVIHDEPPPAPYPPPNEREVPSYPPPNEPEPAPYPPPNDSGD